MASYFEEEKDLKKRLSLLEQKYRETLFSEGYLNDKLKSEIDSDNFKEITQNKDSPIFPPGRFDEKKIESPIPVIQPKVEVPKIQTPKVELPKVEPPKVPVFKNEVKPVVDEKKKVPEVKVLDEKSKNDLSKLLAKTEQQKVKLKDELLKEKFPQEEKKTGDGILAKFFKMFSLKDEDSVEEGAKPKVEVTTYVPSIDIKPKPQVIVQKKPAPVVIKKIIQIKPVQKKPEETDKFEEELKKRYNGLTNYVRPTEEEVKVCSENFKKIKKEMSKVLIGQEDIVDGLIMGLICNSHVLVEGVPGIAKTLAIRTLAGVIGCDVKRIQFTVDLLPTDIIGITTYTPGKGFEIIKGPVFTNFLIADEINRAPPKTQSALIEAMQEKQVTIGRERYDLPAPFFVMATENPIENAGVYPLPEAQIDRFLFKLIMGYPKPAEEKIVMEANMTLEKFENFNLKSVVVPKDIIFMQDIAKKVYLDEKIKDYILAIVQKTRTRDFAMAQYISYGSSPRASIGLYIASKANALMNGRTYVIPEDVKKVAYNVLRHRLILSYKASIQKVTEDSIIQDILNSVKV